MRRKVGHCLLELVQGDLTRESVDAIVNAANSQLAIGGGVDRAIHEAGGPAIHEETTRLYPQGCPTGQVVASTAGKLNAKFVFHAVGPVWAGGRQGEPEQLRSVYHESLRLAVEKQCESVAFPAISTGIYGYPTDRAAHESLETVIKFLKLNQAPHLVRIVLFGPGAYGAFSRVLQELLPE